MPEPAAPNVSPARLLVVLSARDPETRGPLAAKMRETFAGMDLAIAMPADRAEDGGSAPNTVRYQPVAASPGGWVLRAADFLNAYQLVREHGPQAALLLGAAALSVEPATLRALVEPVLTGAADLALPHYALPGRAGMLNAGILSPLTSSLFCAGIRVPLPIDLCLSPRAAERLATVAQRFTAVRQPEAILWPAIECAVAGFRVTGVPAGGRILPEAPEDEQTATLVQLAQSLFTAIDAHAAFWQRSRVTAARPPRAARVPSSHPVPEEVKPLLDAFCHGFSSDHDTWSLVLPPHTLLGLKRLARTPASEFLMTDALWARIVFDFLLAWRLRTVERTLLLRSLVPLYRAWVASQLLQGSGPESGEHATALADTFEADRPYLIARWRWPDRFNP